MRRLIAGTVVAALLAHAAPAASEAMAMLAVSDPQTQPIALSNRDTRIALVLPSGGNTSSLGARLRSLPNGMRVYLQLQRLKANAAPGVAYNVFLNLPAGTSTAGPDSRHYVGTFNFFNALGDGSRNSAFNITDLVRRLALEGGLAGDVAITVIAAGTPAKAARPTIDRVAIIAE